MAKIPALEGASWVAHRLDMRESPAWAALPDNARRFLDHLEVEHMRHGGTDNGRLVKTYDELEAAGMRRRSIPLAIRQCVALGFVEITRTGYKTSAEFTVTSLYRLTYVFGRNKGARGAALRQNPTDEWRAVASAGDAETRLQAAAQPVVKNKSLGAKTPLLTGAKTPLQDAVH